MHGTLSNLLTTTKPPLWDNRQANVWLGHIASVLLVFTVLAFGAKALVHTDVQARYTPLVIAHGVSMLLWLTLLAGQAYAIAGARFGWHRAIGNASISLVAVMSVTGGILSFNIGEELGRPEVTVVNLAAFATFLPLYFFAIAAARKRRIHHHRLAMLVGTLALMTPAYARVVQVLELPDPVAIAVQVPITALIAAGYDFATKGRITMGLIAMLGFSFGLIAVMVAVLAAFFL